MVRTLTGSAISLFAASALSAGPFTLADYSGGEVFQRFCASCHGETARATVRSRAVLPSPCRISRRSAGATKNFRRPVSARSSMAAASSQLTARARCPCGVTSSGCEAEREMHEVIDRLVDYLESLQP
jgi:hypothetical protein